MGSSAASNAIKNGILFGLVILIIHVAIRNVLVEDEHGPGKQQNQNKNKQQKGTCIVRMADTEAFRAADDADGDADDATGPEAAAAAAAPAAAPARPAARSNRRSEAAGPAPGAAEDLMSYVFGSEAASAAGSAGSSGSSGSSGGTRGAASIQQQQQQQAASCLSAPPKFAPAVADGCGKSALMTAADESNGWMVVGKYSNENVMCGGKIEVAGRALDGYDGSSATFSALAPL
jgi:hypothetical protein